MLFQTNVPIPFAAFFAAAKQGKTGLTVTVDVYRDSTSLLTAQAAVEVGGGLYRYVLASGNTATAGLYTAVFKTADTTVDAQHIPAAEIVGSNVPAQTNAFDPSLRAASGVLAADAVLIGGAVPVSDASVYVAQDQYGNPEVAIAVTSEQRVRDALTLAPTAGTPAAGSIDAQVVVVSGKLGAFAGTGGDDAKTQIAAAKSSADAAARPGAKMDLVDAPNATGLGALALAVWAAAGRTLTAVADSSGVTTLLSRISASRAGWLDNLNVGGPVASHADVNSLTTASPLARLVTVDQYLLPASGSVLYPVILLLVSEQGAAADPDGNTIVTTVTNGVGADRSANFSGFARVTTGRWSATYTVASTAATEPLQISASGTVAGTAFTQSVAPLVASAFAVDFTTNDRAQLTAVYNKLPAGGAAIGDATAAEVAAVGTTAAGIAGNYARQGDAMALTGGALASVASRVLATPANPLATDSSGRVAVSNLPSTFPATAPDGTPLAKPGDAMALTSAYDKAKTAAQPIDVQVHVDGGGLTPDQANALADLHAVKPDNKPAVTSDGKVTTANPTIVRQVYVQPG